jgi:hypothetical protein
MPLDVANQADIIEIYEKYRLPICQNCYDVRLDEACLAGSIRSFREAINHRDPTTGRSIKIDERHARVIEGNSPSDQSPEGQFPI